MGRIFPDIIIVLAIAALAVVAFITIADYLSGFIGMHNEALIFMHGNNLMWLIDLLFSAFPSMIAAYLYHAVFSKKVKVTNLMIISFFAFVFAAICLVLSKDPMDMVYSWWTLRFSVIYAFQVPLYVLIIHKLRGRSKNKVGKI